MRFVGLSQAVSARAAVIRMSDFKCVFMTFSFLTSQKYTEKTLVKRHAGLHGPMSLLFWNVLSGFC